MRQPNSRCLPGAIRHTWLGISHNCIISQLLSIKVCGRFTQSCEPQTGTVIPEEPLTPLQSEDQLRSCAEPLSSQASGTGPELEVHQLMWKNTASWEFLKFIFLFLITVMWQYLQRQTLKMPEQNPEGVSCSWLNFQSDRWMEAELQTGREKEDQRGRGGRRYHPELRSELCRSSHALRPATHNQNRSCWDVGPLCTRLLLHPHCKDTK